jgi:hypothetical protein
MGRVPDLDVIAKKNGVDPDELERLFIYGCLAWKELTKHFPNARTEQLLEGDGIRGHADVFHRDDSTMTILDWKTNRVRRDYRSQVLGYATAAADQFGFPESGEIQVAIVWLRFFEFEVITVTQDDIERLHHEIDAAKLNIGKRYAPGDPCDYCSRQLVCDARHEYLASATSALMPINTVEILPEVLPTLYTKAKLLRKALSAYDKALKMALKSGPLPDGEGNLLELDELKRDKLIPREAWSVLVQQGFSEDEMAQCISMSKTKVLEVVSGKVKRGQKGTAKTAMINTLREFGAVTQTVSETVRVKKDGIGD